MKNLLIFILLQIVLSILGKPICEINANASKCYNFIDFDEFFTDKIFKSSFRIQNFKLKPKKCISFNNRFFSYHSGGIETLELYNINGFELSDVNNQNYQKHFHLTIYSSYFTFYLNQSLIKSCDYLKLNQKTIVFLNIGPSHSLVMDLDSSVIFEYKVCPQIFHRIQIEKINLRSQMDSFIKKFYPI